MLLLMLVGVGSTAVLVLNMMMVMLIVVLMITCTMTWQKFRASSSMHVTGSNIPNPILTFEEMPFPEKFFKLISSKGFTSPTPIQGQSWPVLMQGRDLVGQSWTG